MRTNIGNEVDAKMIKLIHFIIYRKFDGWIAGCLIFHNNGRDLDKQAVIV